MQHTILADGRWRGPFGIGRFSSEILSRLKYTDILTHGPKPLSAQGLVWLPYHLHKNKLHYQCFFAPGFNPILYSPIPFVFTICDLIHLHTPSKTQVLKKIYYDKLIKPAALRANHLITISEYSKNSIMEWSNISSEKITVVNCGISQNFNTAGIHHAPGYPYLLHVGNTKSHKNIPRLIHAFAHARIDKHIRLILTGTLDPSLAAIIKQYKLENRIVWSGVLSEEQLAEHYRGAIALLFPSLYEGFGLPVLESMACGTPVLTANTTSLPEVSGDAAFIINPYETDAITDGIEQLVHDASLRESLITKGHLQSKQYSWDDAATTIQRVLLTIV